MNCSDEYQPGLGWGRLGRFQGHGQTHQEVQIWGGPSERWAIGKKSLLCSGCDGFLAGLYSDTEFSKGGLAILFSLDQRYIPLPLD